MEVLETDAFFMCKMLDDVLNNCMDGSNENLEECAIADGTGTHLR